MGGSSAGSGRSSRVANAVVLLDWYRTLSGSLFWEPWMTSEDAALRAVAGGMADALFGRPNDTIEPWLRGQVSAEAAIARVAPAAAVDPVLALRGLAESCAGMTFLSPAMLAAVRRLRAQGIAVGIATDNMDTFTRWTVPALGLDRWFDPILNSADLGAVKGDPPDGSGRSPFFGAFLAGLTPGTNVFLVDDSAEIAGVVEAAGITFCHVTASRDALAWLDRLGDSLRSAGGPPAGPPYRIRKHPLP